MLRVLVPLLLTFSSFCGLEAQNDSTVLVRVYYESLCPDSIAFIRNQLMPTWATLGQYMRVDFVPFGKASSTPKPGGGLHFECQHGPQECVGNMIQACALSNLLTDHDRRVEFVGCFMGIRDPRSAGAQCSTAVGLDFSVVDTCANSPAGEALLYNYGQRTLDLYPDGIPFVPTITFNNKFDQDAQTKALRDLKSVVCAYIPEVVRPAQCL